MEKTLRLLSLITIAIFISSCSMDKRMYRGGFYIEHPAKIRNRNAENFRDTVPVHHAVHREDSIQKACDDTLSRIIEEDTTSVDSSGKRIHFKTEQRDSLFYKITRNILHPKFVVRQFKSADHTALHPYNIPRLVRSREKRGKCKASPLAWFIYWCGVIDLWILQIYFGFVTIWDILLFVLGAILLLLSILVILTLLPESIVLAPWLTPIIGFLVFQLDIVLLYGFVITFFITVFLSLLILLLAPIARNHDGGEKCEDSDELLITSGVENAKLVLGFWIDLIIALIIGAIIGLVTGVIIALGYMGIRWVIRQMR
ncbi:MAG TPA: hypothetical protein VL651_11075 [Bacteroidia bacterium]|jgi:hypothetical protein|nr:hypothetical protein [Bacteroidia bacterium]